MARKTVRGIQSCKILIAGKCFMSYSFGILKVQRGKDKTPWTQGSFQKSTQRIKYTAQRPHQAHSTPKRALDQRQPPSLVKKNHKRYLSYQKMFWQQITYYTTLKTVITYKVHCNCLLTMPFWHNWKNKSQTVISTYHIYFEKAKKGLRNHLLTYHCLENL